MSGKNLPPAQLALNERYEAATTEEELAQLVEEQDRLNAERDAILSTRLSELAIGADGVVVDKSTLDAERAAGRDVNTTPYDSGRRN